MAFSSIVFLFGFLPITLGLYFLCPRRWRSVRNTILLVLSVAFYAFGGLKLLPALGFYCLVAWGGGLLCGPEKPHRKAVMIGAVGLMLAALAFYKYGGMALKSLQAMGMLTGAAAILLPAGISFFAFQAIAYVADVYRGTMPAEKNPLRIVLFLAFFPQLLQGPILRYGEFAPALTERRETVSDAAAGFVRFCFGLGKKVLLADMLGQIADGVFSADGRLTVSLAWLGAIAYTLQLYFDFSGYTDMALGLGRVLGFRLPENFNYPYISRSASEFWRRWHMTLSFWFRDYVYIPLGGNRCSRNRQLLNLLAVWVLTGIWHGSTWNFVLWGLYYAALLMGEKFLWGRKLEALPAALRHAYALVLVTIGWVLFRCADLSQIGRMLSAMFGFAPRGFWSGETTYYLIQFHWELAAAVIAALPVKNWLQDRLSRSKNALSELMLTAGPRLLALALLGYSTVRLLSSTFRSFLYFQF